MSAGRAALALVAALGLWTAPAAGHEERLLVGRVETIDPARRLMVVRKADGERRRLEVNPETEVIACRTRAGLTAVRAGGLVRVKYLEKPGNAAEAQSMLLLGGLDGRARGHTDGGRSSTDTKRPVETAV